MPKNTKINAAGSQAVPQYVWVLLASLTVFVYFFGLTVPLLGPDEPRYAQVAREMFERGDWITPTLGGFNWFEKPILLYWLQIVSYKIFGVNEFAARFGPALFGLGTVLSLWVLGRISAAERTDSIEKSEPGNFAGVSRLNSLLPNEGRSFANWLALIAASTLGILVFSRGASFDIIITFPLTAALVCFYIFDRSTDLTFAKKYLPLLLFYVFIGCALLAKGLIGVVFPFAIVAFYYLLSGRLPCRVFIISLIWGTLIAAAAASVWYLPMYNRHGYEFINEFFVQHHFQRFTSNKYRHPQPFYFFLWILPLMTLPWLPFFFAAIWTGLRRLLRRVPVRSHVARSPLLRFAIAWLVVPLVFFSFSGSKLPGYILPAVPAAVILTAIFIFGLVQKSSRWRNTVLVLSVSTFGVVILLLIFAMPRFAATDSVKSLVQAANERGYTQNRILMFRTLSHNAEFYAAGRLLRDETGKQRRLNNVNEILTEIALENGRPSVVLLPIEQLPQLKQNPQIKTEVIKDNGDLQIALVSLNPS